MAVIEIAKIQVRRGDATVVGMPQLDTGELGWAIAGTSESNNPQLFIGNKTTDGAAITTNTRILTVLDIPNIFDVAKDTTYQFEGNDSSVYIDPAMLVERTIQEGLDDASVNYRNFKVLSHTTSTNLQNALLQLFWENNSGQSLVLPKGQYLVDRTITIPPNSTIVGEGIGKTVIVMTTSTVPLFKSNTATNISIQGMTIKYAATLSPAQVNPLMVLNRGQDSVIQNVEFSGQGVGYISTNDNNLGIRLTGNGFPNDSIQIRDCIFDNTTNAISADDDIYNAVIHNNRFQSLYRGIVYSKNAGSPGSSVGPRLSRISRNNFYSIEQEGVYVAAQNATDHTNHILTHNIYEDVGNGTTHDDFLAVTSPVYLQTYGNISENEYFSRVENLSVSETLGNFFAPVNGHVSLIDNRVKQSDLDSGFPDATLIKLPFVGYPMNIEMKYHIDAPGIGRWGSLYIVVNSNSIVDVTDEYRFSADDTGIVFAADISLTGHRITVNYTGNTVVGTITYQINQFY
jgi:hypothetical protein